MSIFCLATKLQIIGTNINNHLCFFIFFAIVAFGQDRRRLDIKKE